MTTCKRCGKEIAAKGPTGKLRTFCSPQCAGAWGRARKDQKIADHDRAVSDGVLDPEARRHKASLEHYLARRRERLARTEKAIV